jgi:hypothetical protein
MRYIQISDKIKVTLTVELPDGSKKSEEIELSALEVYAYLSDSDNEFNSDLKGTKSSMRIDTAIRNAKKESLSYLVLEEEDWKRLKNAAEKPSAGYPIRPAKRIQPFIEAVINASDSPPAVIKTDENDVSLQ